MTWGELSDKCMTAAFFLQQQWRCPIPEGSWPSPEIDMLVSRWCVAFAEAPNLRRTTETELQPWIVRRFQFAGWKARQIQDSQRVPLGDHVAALRMLLVTEWHGARRDELGE